jgi:membrane protein DedA with SNARE-associated domain
MDQFLDRIFLLADSPVALFFTMFFASIVNTFFPPVPIEFGTVFAGYIVSEGHGSMLIIISSTALGMSVGGIILYEIARRYGAHYFDKKFFSKMMPESLYEKTIELVYRYGVGSLFLAKFIPGMNFCAIVCAGLFKLGHVKTYAGIIASNIVIFSLLAFIGKLAGDNWPAAFKLFGKTAGITAIIIILLLIAAHRYRKFKNAGKP